ncbi:MAG: PASTA domain-containing protein [Candidatus Kapabacteria bacterium]|nr:PASTA domain-containing protein [Candidatus Kapabacteria bacterium]
MQTDPSSRPYDPITWKVGIMIMFFAVAFGAVGARLFWVQVIEGARYRELARKQYESKVELRAERGRVFDRSMRDVATMMRVTSFAADPTMLKQPELVADLLAMADGRPREWYLDRIRNHKGRFVWLARSVNTVMYPLLDTMSDPGLIRVREPKRHFVYGPVAAQIVGTTDVDNNGLTGLELQYDSLLRGTGGFVVMQRDGRGRLRPSVNPEREAPRNGLGLQLTIDVEMQRVVEQELERGVRETGAASGTVIALDPATGDVLAMASWPSFDPTRLDRATTDAIRIRGITDMYEPGSTMKAITAAALLEERRIAPDDPVDGLGGRLDIGGYVITDDHPLWRTTFRKALEQSSNVVFASSTRLLDDRVLYKYVRDFGFGIPTGIDLPGEVRGRLKRPNEFDPTTKRFMAFGYEMSSTALQMVTAYAAIANKGVMMQPRVVKAFIEPGGRVRNDVRVQTVRRVIGEQTAAMLTNMLTGVVDRGTATAAAIPGVKIAGKTGTAKQLVDGAYSSTNYTASFVGYYPAQAPRVAMIVMMDRPTSTIYGGTAAAPVFRRIVQKTMTMMQLDADTRDRIAASAAADTVVVPDVRGLDAPTATGVLQRLGLRVDRALQAAAGTVQQQQPAHGTRSLRGTTIALRMTSARGSARPDVRGFLLRRAIAALHGAGYDVRVRGSGTVREQHWSGDTCTLEAR